MTRNKSGGSRGRRSDGLGFSGFNFTLASKTGFLRRNERVACEEQQNIGSTRAEETVLSYIRREIPYSTVAELVPELNVNNGHHLYEAMLGLGLGEELYIKVLKTRKEEDRLARAVAASKKSLT